MLKQIREQGMDGYAPVEFIERERLMYLLIFGAMTCIAGVALLVAATLMVLPTGLAAADFFAAGFLAGASASVFFTAVLRGAFFGASSAVVCDAVK